jgi:hypothetical protein
MTAPPLSNINIILEHSINQPSDEKKVPPSLVVVKFGSERLDEPYEKIPHEE